MSTPALPVLFVDDEPENLALFKMQFARTFEARTAASGDDALAIMAREDIGVVLTDERMPGMSGVDLLARAAEGWPDTVRVIVSAYSDSPRLLRAINRGHAHDYIVKPWDKDELAACIARWLSICERKRELRRQANLAEVYAHDIGESYDTTHVVGEHGGLKDVVRLARRVAQSDATVLITGETGTGKELIARLLHEASPRCSRPFVRVNCAALAEGAPESKLFGHEQAMLTGAHAVPRGRFELADSGTIFLDEIGEMSAKEQATLLRVLGEKEIERVGGSSPIRVNVRVLAATNRDLLRLVNEGRFREDLYYRIVVVTLHIPALRERKEDVRPLVQHFLAKHGPRIGRIATVDAEVYDYLEACPWKGNVRELENIVQRALAVADGPELTVEDFAFDIDEPQAATSASLRDDLKDEERRRIEGALDRCQGNQTRAAKLLGMPRRTLVERLRTYGITRPRR